MKVFKSHQTALACKRWTCQTDRALFETSTSLKVETVARGWVQLRYGFTRVFKALSPTMIEHLKLEGDFGKTYTQLASWAYNQTVRPCANRTLAWRVNSGMSGYENPSRSVSEIDIFFLSSWLRSQSSWNKTMMLIWASKDVIGKGQHQQSPPTRMLPVGLSW